MKQSRTASKLVWLAVGCAFVGFLDATYLTANHLAGKVPPCTVGGGCNEVLTSSFATVGPVPMALAGMLFFAAAALSGIAYIDRGARKALQVMLALAVTGLAVSSVLVYAQLVVLQSICTYCMISAFTTLAYGAASLWAAIFHIEPTGGPDR